MQKTLPLFVLGLLLAAAACAPEYVDSSLNDETGWRHMAIGLCEATSALEDGRSCSEASACTSYCCECNNGTQYTVAVCYKDEGCADFGQACAEGKADACPE